MDPAALPDFSLTRSLRTVAFDAVYDAEPRDPEPSE